MSIGDNVCSVFILDTMDHNDFTKVHTCTATPMCLKSVFQNWWPCTSVQIICSTRKWDDSILKKGLHVCGRFCVWLSFYSYFNIGSSLMWYWNMVYNRAKAKVPLKQKMQWVDIPVAFDTPPSHVSSVPHPCWLMYETVQYIKEYHWLSQSKNCS